MRIRYLTLGCVIAVTTAVGVRAEEPVASYIFPAGGQRGTACQVRVGGLFLHEGCGFQLDSPELRASAPLERVATTWFEGPLIPLPESQQAESYPQDYATSIAIGADARLGANYWRLSTSQGATPARRFIVGELPEIVEQEIDGEPIPVAVTLPVTINGRIFPREDVDLWSFPARQGQAVRAEVCAARLGSPLEARLEVTDSQGRALVEAIGPAGGDPSLAFTPEADGIYTIRIHDISFGGLQHYVYRLTLASGPHVASVFPLGARRGQPARFELIGSGLPSAPVESQLPDAPQSTIDYRFDLGGQLANPVPIELDDLPELLEREPNDDAGRAEPVEISSIVNGRIQSPGDVDWYAFTAAKDQAYDLDLRAGRLGSPLDPVLVVRDSAGRELARCDDVAAGNTDSRCRFTAPADGNYTVSVEERLASRGGPGFAYRLRIDRFRPDFRLVLATDAVNLVRGGESRLRIDVDAPVPLEPPIELTVEGLPPGVTVDAASIPAKTLKTELKFTAANEATLSTGRMTVRGRARFGEQEIVRTAELNVPRGDPVIEQVAWAVALPTPFKFVGNYRITFEPRGGYVTRHYRLERGGYAGPVEVFLADRQLRHLQGVTGPTVFVPAGADEFDYTIYMPPWMELGRTSRTCMAAEATIEEAGKQHVVVYTTQSQNEQIVARVSSGALSLALDREAIPAQPGQSQTVRVNVARDPAQRLPVRLELVAPPHVRGVAAEPVTLGTADSAGQLTIRFADGCGPFNAPLTVRAATLGAPRVAVAEAKLEIVAPR